MAAAKNYNFKNEEALATEHLGCYYLSLNDSEAAKLYLNRSYLLYEIWGAKGKCKDLVSRYENIINSQFSTRSELVQSLHTTSSHSNDNLDVETISQAANTISSEIQFEGLIDTLVKTLLENSGAQYMALAIFDPETDSLKLRATKKMGDDSSSVHDIPAFESDYFPENIIRFVSRTRDTLVFHSSDDLGDFQDDRYFQKRVCKSILCAPIVHQSKLKGLIYLENNIAESTFNGERLKVIQILAAQAAISIENATLFENLEAKTRMEIDLLAAHSVQSAFLPREVEIPGLEVRRYYQSCEQTGGDWYWCHYDEKQNNAYFFLGDVTGHGIPSALLTGAVAGVVCACLYELESEQFQSTAPETLDSIATKINRFVYRTQMFSGLGMTMVLVGINLDSGDGSYLNAGHNPIFLKNGDRVQSILKGGAAFGNDEQAIFGSREFSLGMGNTLFLYTDGLVENKGGASKPIGTKGVKKIVEASGDVDNMADNIKAKMDREWGDKPVEDDVAFIIIHRKDETHSGVKNLVA